MIRDFSKEDLAPAASNDTEVTLGGFALFAMGGCLLLLCAVCFGMGYFVGHRNAPESGSSMALPAADATAPATRSQSGVKPGAATQATSQAERAATSDIQPNDSAVESSASDKAAPAPTADSSQAATRPAVQGENGEQAAAGFHVQPALKQAQGWMVQIAAVSHSEDAEVLVNALRRRGYTATARHDAADNLIHVQTGPFVNRNDANAIRQKLLNDGYNAIVQ